MQETHLPQQQEQKIAACRLFYIFNTDLCRPLLPFLVQQVKYVGFDPEIQNKLSLLKRKRVKSLIVSICHLVKQHNSLAHNMKVVNLCLLISFYTLHNSH